MVRTGGFPARRRFFTAIIRIAYFSARFVASPLGDRRAEPSTTRPGFSGYDVGITRPWIKVSGPNERSLTLLGFKIMPEEGDKWISGRI